jgi:GcrA cell cycle regulator
MSTDVWALDLLPVVAERKAGMIGRLDTFSEDQLKLIVDMRDGGEKWEAIGLALNRPWKSCQRRYFKVVEKRGELPAQPRPATRAVHKLSEELGIGSTIVWQAQIGSFGNVNKVPITLSSGMNNMAWTKGQDDMLRDCLASGGAHSEAAKQINEAFGTSYTRNATIGRAHRLDIESLITASVAASRPRRPRAVKPSTPHIRPRSSVCVKEIPLLRCVEVEPRHLGLLDLDRGDCRYPYGGEVKGDPITFCGCSAIEGLPYCASHTVLSRRAAA